ncbi:2-succinyl-5-enolpyruvyl-6-hydroxy-3-cyclohexene-1-carboxylic-acid synthase [Streptomyces violascens]|uniref:2-succinyl-5-enolpyruvyl-6-hydroxy-3- cyclohexene-1-carboxylic-acid synthase n=1 Tax=Streptomyces violascens TaxID=67381 RepID=UPI0036C0F6D3
MTAYDGLNPSSALAKVMVDELARCGVTDFVIAPARWCAPLAQAAFMHPGLSTHVRYDDRSAGFLALGLSRASGRPVPVTCAPGTAAANLHPAVLEAAHSHVPLVILTADRPPEQRGTGANQTTDQIKLYGGAVSWFAEVGVPELRADSNAYWRTVICRAVAASAAGPVHLNIALRDPLAFDGADQPLPSALDGRKGGRPWTVASAGTHPEVPVFLDISRRGVVVAGDHSEDPAAVVAFAETAGWPLLAEPHSNARYGPNAIGAYVDLMTHTPTRTRLLPEMVLTVGKPGLSPAVLALLTSAETHIAVDPHLEWADPVRSATQVLHTLPRLDGHAPPQWLEAWQTADRTARAALDDLLDQPQLSEPRILRDVLRLIPRDSLCLIGASMPIRDADRAMWPRQGPRIITNRGLNGIDGAVSTAVGAALAENANQHGRTYAVLGDLSLLHDLNGLFVGALQPRPELTIIVINNNGGGIFSMIDSTQQAVGFEELFGTPHNARLADIAAAANWCYETAATPDELPALLPAAGPCLIELRTDRVENAAFHREMHRRVEAALEKSAIRGSVRTKR